MSFLKKLVSRAKSLEGIVSRSFTAEVDGCTFKTPETTAEMSDLRQIAAAVTGAPTKVKVGKDAPKVTDTYGAKIGVASVTYTGAALR